MANEGVRFWQDMVSKAELLDNDRLMVGNGETGETQSIEAFNLPFSKTSELEELAGYKGILSYPDNDPSKKIVSGIRLVKLLVSQNEDDIFYINRFGLNSEHTEFTFRIYNATKGTNLNIFSVPVVESELTGLKRYKFSTHTYDIDLVVDWDTFGLTTYVAPQHAIVVAADKLIIKNSAYNGILSYPDDSFSARIVSAIEYIELLVSENENDTFYINRFGLNSEHTEFTFRINNATKGTTLNIFSVPVVESELVGLKRYKFSTDTYYIDLVVDWDIFELTTFTTSNYTIVITVDKLENIVIPDYSLFQNKVDNSLITSEKTVVGAINELQGSKASISQLEATNGRLSAAETSLLELPGMKSDISSNKSSLNTVESSLQDIKTEYQNLAELVNDAIDGDLQAAVNSEAMQTDIENKLNALETSYAPRLTTNEENITKLINRDAVYLYDYGVSHLNTATQNTTLINQAIADAETAGKSVVFPFVPPGYFIEIDDRIIIEKGNIKLVGHGVQSPLKQTVFPKPIFAVRGDNTEIDNFHLYGIPFSASGMGSLHVENSGVAITGNGAKITRIKANYLSTVVMAGQELIDGVINSPSANIEDTEIIDVESGDNVIFNLLFVNTKNLYFDNIRGMYAFVGAPTPPHLIYASSSDLGNIAVKAGRAFAYNSSGSFAFQLRGITGGEIEYLYSDNCPGVCYIDNSSNLKINEIVSTNDVKISQPESSVDGSLALNQSNNIEIGAVNIKLISDGRGISLTTSCESCSFENIEIESNHTLENLLNYDVSIAGNNHSFENVKVKNLGASILGASVGIRGGENNIINNPFTEGNRFGIYINETAIGTEVSGYNIDDIKSSDAPFYIGSATKFNPFGFIVQNIASFDIVEGYYSSAKLSRYTTSGNLYTSLPTQSFKADNGWISRTVESSVRCVHYIDAGTSTIDLRAKIKYADREALAAHVITNNKMISAYLNHSNNKAQLVKFDESGITVLSEIDFNVQIGRVYDYRFMAFGDYLEFYVDEVKLCSAILSPADLAVFGSISTYGLASMSNSGGLYKNIEWRVIE